MASNGIHELTAAYALHALDDLERQEFEQHLRTCERCREELAALQEAVGSLAFGVPSVEPPPALRRRILQSARSEGQAVVPQAPRPRRRLPAALGAAAAVAAGTAIGVGIWAASLDRSLDRKQEALRVLADPAANEVSLGGNRGRLVVSSTGKAALVVSRLTPAPSGKTYEAWVIEGKTPRRAGLFDAKQGRELFLLERRVPRGSVVAVTLEREGGVDAPTTTPLFTAQA